MKKEITFEIKEHLGIFDDANEQWVGQVNLVSWNGNAPKIDVRYWKVDEPEKNRKLGTLSDDAAKRLAEILKRVTG